MITRYRLANMLLNCIFEPLYRLRCRSKIVVATSMYVDVISCALPNTGQCLSLVDAQGIFRSPAEENMLTYQQAHIVVIVVLERVTYSFTTTTVALEL